MIQPVPAQADRQEKSYTVGTTASMDRGVILLAVDEPSVGRMLMGVLTRSGVTGPVWMGGPAESLDWLRDTDAGVALLLIDCHFSTAESLEFCEKARCLRPGITVIIAGSRDQKPFDGVLGVAGPTHYVPKPYLPTELAWQLRGLLAA